jgi:hypothetical protein
LNGEKKIEIEYEGFGELNVNRGYWVLYSIKKHWRASESGKRLMINTRHGSATVYYCLGFNAIQILISRALIAY